MPISEKFSNIFSRSRDKKPSQEDEWEFKSALEKLHGSLKIVFNSSVDMRDKEDYEN